MEKKLKNKLTNEEKRVIKVLNFVATFDGLIKEDEIKYLLDQGIDKFISKKHRHLVTISETDYPTKIKVKKTHGYVLS